MREIRNSNQWKKQRKIEYLKQKTHKFYIFCEGEKTEPNYFRGFKNVIEQNPIYKNMVLLEIHPSSKDTVRMVMAAEKYVKLNSIINAEIWCVYDKDDFTNSDFDNAVQLADKLNQNQSKVHYNCAWSNECVEIWFILHFAYYTSDNHRNEYLKYLDKVFLDRAGHKYRKNMENIFDLLVQYGNPKQAIINARKLLSGKELQAPSQISPGTAVYQIVEKLAVFLPEDIRSHFI